MYPVMPTPTTGTTAQTRRYNTLDVDVDVE